ncbi:hypothetical protein [Sandarakinorhabdus sp.]|uniref:beta strand repeat-containing protein n=1 Tax=Sandarakinorhabdus sp. TaxID=1916663 RepID=UPI00286DB356|nr:hypothetical protein [Sandarakinorhabdus sp.]
MIAANGNGNRGAGGVGKGGTALAEIFGAGGTLLVGGGLMVNANGGGGTGFGSPTPAGDGVGGNARAELLGGQLTIKGDAGLLLSATGVGGSGFGGARGGSGFSGAATLLLDAGGDVSVSQSANIDVSSTGGSSSFIAGNALVRDGGGVQLRLGAGNAPARLFVGGDLSVVAGADGGTASAPGIGGDARGADVRLDILSGLADVAGAIAVDSDAQGGGGTTGGAAQGGTVSAMLAGGGAAPGLGRITIAVDARGGNGAAGDSIGDGGSATGGSINLVVGAGSQLIGPALLQVLARGGSSVDGDGGGATGGNLSLRAEGAQARLSGPVVLISESFGGDGSARGGDSAGGAISLDALAGGQLQVGAPGIKGSALAMAQGGFGSVGTGGNANPLELGGGVTARATGSGSVLAFVGDMLLQTGGQGGGGRSGGGNGKGSGITLATNGGRMEALGLVVADAGGAGGSASSAGNGGSGRSGNIDIRIQGLAGTDSMALGGVQASAIGRGGLGSNNADGTGGNGGDAFGGKVTIGAAGSAGQFSAGQTIVVADAFGGGGGGGGDGGNGGDAVGGEVLIGTGTAASAAGGQFAWTSMDASANAFGGSGGPGDAGGSNGNIGGARAVSSRMVINGGNATVTGDAVLTARASGGNAPVIGGLAELAVAPGLASKLTISGAARLSSAASAVNPAASVAGAARVTAIGGALELASLDVSVSGNTLAPDAAPTVLAAGTGGTITATGAAQVIARTEVALGDAGTMTFGGELRVAAGENLRQGIAGLPASFGPIRAGRLVLNAGGNIIIASTLTADGEGQIFTGGDISLGNVKAGTILTVQGRSITAGAVRGDEWARLFSSETMTLGSLSAGVIAQMFADGALVVGNVDAGISAPPAGTTGDIYLRSLASISAGTLTSSGNAGAAAAGIITTGTVSAGNIAVQLSGGDITNGGFVLPATGTIYLGNFSQRPLISFAGVAADYTALLAAVPTVVPGRVTINGNVATGRITANAADALRIRGSLTAAIGATLSGQSLTLGDITAAGFLDFTSRSDLTIGNLVAAGAVTFAVTGNIVTGAVQSGGSISLTATQDAAGLGGAIATGALTADDDIRLSSTGNLTTGALTALDSVFLTALTPQRLPATLPVITTGNIRTGAVERRGLVFINSAGSVVSGNISATGSVGVIGQGGPVTTGTIATGSSPIVLLDPGGITTGALSTSNAGAIFIANHALLPQITFDQAGNPQYAALLASVPVRLDGFVTIGGPATTGRFVSASTGAFSAQAITAAQSVTIDSGALATLAGNVAAPTITVTSRDIVIGAGALIGGGNTSAITLGASNDAGASIGGTGGTGYSLDNAEFGRLRASNITVRLAGSTLMTIGDLTLTGSGAASAGNRISLIADGGIRVAGLVTMANAGPADVLALTAGTRLEVITDAGGIRLGSSGDTPAGNLEISSGDVWVVTAAVQAQLAQNSNFAGRDRLLGLAPTTPDLAGRLVASRIQIGALRTVLIQNTGSAFARAAFTAGSLAVRAGSDQAGALLDVVINGRIAGDAGFIINNQTRDVVSFLPATDNLTLTSSVNGCLIRGVCSAGADNQAIATIINNIAELTQPREEEREKLSRSLPQLPIIIQQQLIDLTELFADPDIDDPVTSSGNPSLWQDNRLGSRPATGGQK